MNKTIVFSPEDFRETLEELFAFIPYFEERVNGTFKFQYYDGEKKQLVDYDGYEEKNRVAKFPDPMYDSKFERFKCILFEKIWNKLGLGFGFRPPHPQEKELSPDELFWFILYELIRDVVHERMCTGNTASCMASGTYLNELKVLQGIMNKEINSIKDIEAMYNNQ